MKKVFISCTVPNINDWEHHRRMNHMEFLLRKYKFQQVEGFFEGKKEISFRVSGVTSIQPFLELAKRFEQDSIMVVNSYGGAGIISTDESVAPVFIGQLVTSKIKPWSGDYSYNPRTLEYYYVTDREIDVLDLIGE
jgi:hypothetical protein